MDPKTKPPPADTSTGGTIKSLLQDLRSETTQLLQKEAQLARTELAEKAARMGSHVARIGIGGFVAWAGLIVLLIGLGDLAAVLLAQAGVDAGAARWIGRVGVGLIVAVIGWIMYAQARRAVRSDSLVPEQTLQSVRENQKWMQSKLQHSHEAI